MAWSHSHPRRNSQRLPVRSILNPHLACKSTNTLSGFNLALTSGYNWILLILIALVVAIIIPFAFWRWRKDKRRGKTPLFGGFDRNGDARGYQAQPWTSGQESRTDIQLSSMNYPPIGQNSSPQPSPGMHV